MKAISKTKEGVTLQEKEIPFLARHGVLIKITLAGLCRTDLYAAQNKIPLNEGLTLGHEFTGFIEKTGVDVRGLYPGQRVSVMPLFMHDHHQSMLGIDRDGAYADYIVLPASQVYPIPDHLTDEEAAFMEPVAASLAVLKAPIDSTQRGLIYGDSRIAELTRRILALKGFDKVDICSDHQTLELDDDYDFIIETSATTQAFENIVRALKPQGLLVLKSRPFTPVPLPITAIVRKELTLVGVHYGDFQEGIDLVATHALHVRDLFGPTYSLEEAIPILLGHQKTPEDKKVFFKPCHESV
jgi:L-iditol 2-dehydrogenase